MCRSTHCPASSWHAPPLDSNLYLLALQQKHTALYICKWAWLLVGLVCSQESVLFLSKREGIITFFPTFTSSMSACHAMPCMHSNCTNQHSWTDERRLTKMGQEKQTGNGVLHKQRSMQKHQPGFKPSLLGNVLWHGCYGLPRNTNVKEYTCWVHLPNWNPCCFCCCHSPCSEAVICIPSRANVGCCWGCPDPMICIIISNMDTNHMHALDKDTLHSQQSRWSDCAWLFVQNNLVINNLEASNIQEPPSPSLHVH